MNTTTRLQHRKEIWGDLVNFIPNSMFMRAYDNIMNNNRTYTSTYHTLTYKDISLLMLYLLHKPHDSKILSTNGGVNLLDYSIDKLSNFNTIFNTPTDFLKEFSFDRERQPDNEYCDQLIIIGTDWIINNGCGEKYESMNHLLDDLSSVYPNVHVFDRRPPPSSDIYDFVNHSNFIRTDWGNNDFT